MGIASLHPSYEHPTHGMRLRAPHETLIPRQADLRMRGPEVAVQERWSEAIPIEPVTGYGSSDSVPSSSHTASARWKLALAAGMPQ